MFLTICRYKKIVVHRESKKYNMLFYFLKIKIIACCVPLSRKLISDNVCCAVE